MRDGAAVIKPRLECQQAEVMRPCVLGVVSEGSAFALKRAVAFVRTKQRRFADDFLRPSS
jgi:hypothetical protein